jgi:hypothetical protein
MNTFEEGLAQKKPQTNPWGEAKVGMLEKTASDGLLLMPRHKTKISSFVFLHLL